MIQMFLLKENKTTRLFFFFLTSLAGIILLTPFLDFQVSLAQGDHGANLYAFAQTAQGKIPYKDFWYPYGPLMLYYYGFFLKIFGENIQSVLIGLCLLKFLGGLFCYLSLSLFIFPFLAFIGGVWFFVFCPDFFITYNHNSVFTLSLISLYCLFSYLKNSRKIDVFIGLISLFLVLFIRVNMGFFLILAFLACLFWIDSVNKTSFLRIHKSLSGILLIFLFGVSLLLTYFFSSQFPSYSLPGYLSYFKNLGFPWIFFSRIKFYLSDMIFQNTSSWPNLLFSIFALLTAVQTILLIFSKNCEKQFKNIILLAIGISSLFLFLASHEYLASNVIYRILWMAPFEIILVFLCVGFGTRTLPPLILLLIYFAILIVPFNKAFATHTSIQQLKKPSYYLNLEKGQIYTANSAEWTTTVTETVNYLNHHLNTDDIFLALPYEPLYYFLTGKKSPLWNLLLMQPAGIDRKEKDIIQTLEENKIKYIVLSNRANSSEKEVGVFGQTYLVNLYSTIMEHYEEVETFGDWEKKAGWNTNHAIKILRRKER